MVTEATFDVDARKDWLQGFRKRKRERRLTGLAHGALKARKQKLADRAARRSMRPPPAPEPVVLDEAPATRETVVLTDSNVVEQWGAAVTVTTTVGGLDVDAEDADAAEALLRGAHAPPPKKRVDAALPTSFPLGPPLEDRIQHRDGRRRRPVQLQGAPFS